VYQQRFGDLVGYVLVDVVMLEIRDGTINHAAPLDAIDMHSALHPITQSAVTILQPGVPAMLLGKSGQLCCRHPSCIAADVAQ